MGNYGKMITQDVVWSLFFSFNIACHAQFSWNSFLQHLVSVPVLVVYTERQRELNEVTPSFHVVVKSLDSSPDVKNIPNAAHDMLSEATQNWGDDGQWLWPGYKNADCLGWCTTGVKGLISSAGKFEGIQHIDHLRQMVCMTVLSSWSRMCWATRCRNR